MKLNKWNSNKDSPIQSKRKTRNIKEIMGVDLGAQMKKRCHNLKLLGLFYKPLPFSSIKLSLRKSMQKQARKRMAQLSICKQAVTPFNLETCKANLQMYMYITICHSLVKIHSGIYCKQTIHWSTMVSWPIFGYSLHNQQAF